jgi:hypothetical protein
LAGRFTLERGLARAQSLELSLDHTTATVAGVVDLLLWAADLTLELQASDPVMPMTLQIVGPLDEPQTRVRIPQPVATEP